MSSRDFNQDTAGAKRAAESGPVVITDRGRPAHVLLSWAEYARLAEPKRIFALLGSPPEVAEVDFDPPRLEGSPAPARLD